MRVFLYIICSIVLAWETVRGITVCYERVGCFADGAPYSSPNRPLNLVPKSPDLILTRHLLYTQESKSRATILDARVPETFMTIWPEYKLRPTKIIVHSYNDNPAKTMWMTSLKDELLTNGDYNVILVDWHSGSGPPLIEAVGNSRLIGAQIADLIKAIMSKTNQSATDFHIIGHGVGAHLAGYAGERVPGLGRISGLDPYGPLFVGSDPVVRLDDTDATFVDVIHTDGRNSFHFGLGIEEQIGHVDFYPNLGHNQPGCNDDADSQSCNHERAIHLYTESINTHCPFTAFSCTSQAYFQAGQCRSCRTSTCNPMGFHANQSAQHPTKFYLTTAKQTPFCEYHISISVQLNNTGHHERGDVRTIVTGDKAATEWITLNDNPIDFQPGKTLDFTLGIPHDIGHVTSLQMSWHHVAPVGNIFEWDLFGLRHPKLNLDNVLVSQWEVEDTLSFCVNDSVLVTDQVLNLTTPC